MTSAMRHGRRAAHQEPEAPPCRSAPCSGFPAEAASSGSCRRTSPNPPRWASRRSRCFRERRYDARLAPGASWCSSHRNRCSDRHLDASSITAIRTAAVSAVMATRALSRLDAGDLAIWAAGCRREATWTMGSVRALHRVRAWSPIGSGWRRSRWARERLDRRIGHMRERGGGGARSRPHLHHDPVRPPVVASAWVAAGAPHQRRRFQHPDSGSWTVRRWRAPAWWWTGRNRP
jgi:hypothetical protein